jgi:hypothetical protein
VVSFQAEKTSDNKFLSHLVDILVKVKEMDNDCFYFDALISSCVGIDFFVKTYNLIIDADTKLKAWNIKMEMTAIIKSLIFDQNKYKFIFNSFENFIKEFQCSAEKLIEELYNHNGKATWLDPDKRWKFELGTVLYPIENLNVPNTQRVIFYRYKPYTVIKLEASHRKGFYLINEYNQEHYLYFGKKGWADKFFYFDSPLPEINNHINSWVLFIKFFNNDFLDKSLKNISPEMTKLKNDALNHVNTSEAYLNKLYYNCINNFNTIFQMNVKEVIKKASEYFDKTLVHWNYYEWSLAAIMLVSVIILNDHFHLGYSHFLMGIEVLTIMLLMKLFQTIRRIMIRL